VNSAPALASHNPRTRYEPRTGPDGEGLTVITEQVAEFGGMERVVHALLARYPAATLFAVRFETPPGFPPDDFESRLVERGLADGRVANQDGRARLIGRSGRRHPFLAPLYAHRIGSTPVDSASVVLSLNNGWTHAVTAPPGARHVGYTGGPPRPFYGHTSSYAAEYPALLRPLLWAAVPALRAHWRKLMHRPQRLVANSRDSAERVGRIAGRSVGVLYPPVRTSFFTPADRSRSHFLAVSRLRAHKRLDVLIEAFRGLRERLLIVGGGPELARLAASAPANVRFVGHVGDDELRELYRSSRGLVSASVEEFGLCLAEAQATGLPVIAPRAGGANEVVHDGETGILLDDVEPSSVARAVRQIERLAIDPATCRLSAQRFSEERFVEQLEDLLED
jgi:glycosyltransferase involved in cell wall biosynthesis